MSPKFDEESNYDTDDENPKVDLRMHDPHQKFKDNRSRVSLRMTNSSSSHGKTLYAITSGKYKVSLKVVNDPKHASSYKQVAPLTISSYDLMSQLQ